MFYLTETEYKRGPRGDRGPAS